MNTIYEDNQILVLEKPAGVVVNRSITHTGPTVQDYVEDQIDFTDLEDATDFYSRSGVVHRLDKDTSGVLLVAKTSEAFANLLSQFKNRQVKKEYRAVVIGKSPEGLFNVTAPLARNPKNRFSMAVTKEGKEAQTEFETIEHLQINDKEYSYLKAFPLTGRTHQIRVHLAVLNLPVAADQIYDTRAQLKTSSEAFNRMMLHALNIQFTHPHTGIFVKFEAPLPQEFLKYN